jgi:chromosome segregation ATPase
MESSNAGPSGILGCPSRKRRSSPESNSSLDQHGIRPGTVDRDRELIGNDSPQLLRQLETKNRELEARINGIYAEFKTMASGNQDLKSQVQNLQQQYDRLLSHNRELESRINRFEHRSQHTETINQDVPRQIYNLEQHSPKMEPVNPDVDQLVKDFEERCDLVESNNQALTERLDTCQQNFFKMRLKNEGFENQLTSLQQRLNNFGMHDENIQYNQAIPTQQLTEDDLHQNLYMTVKTELTDNMNTPKGKSFIVVMTRKNECGFRYVLPPHSHSLELHYIEQYPSNL